MLMHWLEPPSCFQAIPIHMGHTTASPQKYVPLLAWVTPYMYMHDKHTVTKCQQNYQPLSFLLCVHILLLWNNAVYTWIETGVPRINTYPENNEKSHESWATAYTVRGGHNNIPTNMWAHGYTHTGVHTQVYMTWIVYACWCAMWHIKFIAINQMKCRTLWVSLHVRAVSTCN